jgi:hypothetical protein
MALHRGLATSDETGRYLLPDPFLALHSQCLDLRGSMSTRVLWSSGIKSPDARLLQ